jgi:hypothetical protein
MPFLSWLFADTGRSVAPLYFLGVGANENPWGVMCLPPVRPAALGTIIGPARYFERFVCRRYRSTTGADAGAKEQPASRGASEARQESSNHAALGRRTI